jgi:hypothetical protein
MLSLMLCLMLGLMLSLMLGPDPCRAPSDRRPGTSPIGA